MAMRQVPSAGGERHRLSMHHAVASPTRTSCIQGALPLLPVADDVVLLLLEWLTLMRLPATLRCLQDEYTKHLQRTLPTTDKWVTLTQQLESLWTASDASTTTKDPRSRSILDRLVARAIAQSTELNEKTATSSSSTTVLVSKRPHTASHLKFASKRSLPLGSSQSKSTAALPPPKLLRPQSAIVTSKSTPTLATSSPKRKESHSPVTTNQRPSPVQGHRRASASSPSSKTAHLNDPLMNRTDSRGSLTATASSVRLLHEWSMAQEVEKKMTELTEVKDTNPAGQPSAEPAINLEDMSEERLTEEFSGFSKSAMKRLRRVLAKSSAHSQELQRTRKAMDKIQHRAQVQHERSAMAVQQTELLSSTMVMLIKEPCSLCRYVFLKKNLATKVSYKSVCDLRASWAAKARKEKMKKQNADHGSPETDPPCTADAEEEYEELATLSHTMESTQQSSHLYDEVSVCVFCAQLVLDFSSYRPSSADQKRRKEENRRLAAERSKQRELKRQRDKNKCDPLDFHSYELNSDDEADTVECVEVDAEGRFHLVRRWRPRRRTERAPARVGVVSKRLHYDQLQSRSIHALNKKEWDILTSQNDP